MNFGVDLTACWRPRVGMVTLSLELARTLEARGAAHRWTLLASRSRPVGFQESSSRFLLSPHRNEVANKLYWLPSVESRACLDAILYPYWPSPPRRQGTAPPATIFVHDLAFRLRPDEVPWQQRLYLGTLMPRALEIAAAVICPSATTRQDLLQSYPLQGLDSRVHVIPEGPSPLGDPDEGLPAGLAPGYLLAVGTIEPRKNYRRLANAYARLKQAPPLVIVGRPGWDGGREARFLESVPGVVLLGHVGDGTLARLYADAGLFVFPSLYEGFGLPLLDAMAAGVPALIGRAGALPEVAAGAALEVEPEDVEAIAGGLRRLLDDGDLRRQLATAGSVRASEFSWERAADSVLAILAGRA